MSTTLMAMVYSIAAWAILVRAVLGLNPMGGRTCHGIRVSVWGMSIGALAAAVSPFYGHQVSGADLGLVVGVALYVWRDRRRVFGQ